VKSISVECLPGISKARSKMLSKLGISTTEDIIKHYPRGYENRGNLKYISQLTDGEKVLIKATVSDDCQVRKIRKNLTVTKVHAFDETGRIEITYFNQAYMADLLRAGAELRFFGKVTVNGRKAEMVNPLTESEEKNTGGLMPLYNLTKGITGNMFSAYVRMSLNGIDYQSEETLPEYIRKKHQLCDLLYAYENIHFPASLFAAETAKRRLAFEELLFMQLGLRMLKKVNSGNKGRIFSDFKIAERLAEYLPYELTSAQKRVIREIAKDIKSGKQLNRLVQGDVGSGKTIVACAALMMAAQDSCQGALMAPTEILACQHYEALSPIFSDFGFSCRLLTGSTPKKEKKEISEKLALGEIDILIGTHALIENDVVFKNLALCVTDEQHRFGVKQRNRLFEKGEGVHMLVMSATPIPRTLALILYSDLDISVIDEMPPGRQKVETYLVSPDSRDKINYFLKTEIAKGNRIYAVCPLIEESENSDPSLKSATDYAAELKKALPDARIALLHGKMKPAEKDRIMMDFKNGNTDILVSTTVIEVGVNVPEATVMLIENAERFGLSQLHQLRGRVGRGTRKSYTLLVTNSKGKTSSERMKIMLETTDGFKISEKDLELRGPGDFFGSEQSGFADLKIADLITDIKLLAIASEEAKEILAFDPDLSQKKNILLRKNVSKMFSKDNFIFN